MPCLAGHCLKRNMRKKIIYASLLLAMLLVLSIGIGGIYAGRQKAINKIDTGVVNIQIEEYTLDEDGKRVPWENNIKVLPGTVVNKIPCFTATGNDCYVRATIQIEENVETGHPIILDDFKGISEDWIKIGDYFYYKKILKTNETVDFFHNFTVPMEWDDTVNPRNIGDWGFSVTVTVDAVQSDNFTPNFEGASPWGEVVIKESIHKDGYDINLFTTNSETNMSIIIDDKSEIIVEPDDFFEGFKTMLPGDVLTDSVEIDTDERCKLYFSSESLTDIDLLQNINLKLMLTKNGKQTVVYEGVLDAQIDEILLGEFKKGEKGKLTFTVSMPKELDNEYSLRKASVKWSFRTVKVDIFGNPQTGDNNMVLPYMLLLVVSGCLMIFFTVRKKKER